MEGRPLDRSTLGRGAALGVAALVVVAAAAATLEAVSRADHFFTEEDSQVLGTLLAALLCGGCAYAGLRLLERGARDPLGWLALAVGPVTLVPFGVGLWWLEGWYDHGEILGKIVGTAAVALLSTLVVATNRLLVAPGSRGGRTAFLVVAACAAVIDVIAVAAIWSIHPTGGDTGTATGQAGGRVAFVAGIIGVAAWLLTPLVQRLPPRRRPAP